jgi:glycosyltransferase involved in cell wall biosynthesis
MKVLVTVPAYNEGKTIGGVISEIGRVLRKAGHKYEVIVVDDGSTDGTAAAARKAGADVYSHPGNFGLAEAFRTEMKLVRKRRCDVVVHTDADGQYAASDIPRLIEPIRKGEADLVLGSRFMGKIEHMPLIKRLGNRAFSYFISSIIGKKFTDCQTGFRAFTREFALGVEIRSTHTYTQEMVIRGYREKFRIVEVPVDFLKRRDGKSRLIGSPFTYAAKAWINILRVIRDYEPLKFFGSAGAAMMLAGMAIGAYFLYLHLFTVRGITGHDGLLFLMLIMLFSGLQTIFFGFLADKEG